MESEYECKRKVKRQEVIENLVQSVSERKKEVLAPQRPDKT